jgi:hypothetical protein
MSDQTSAICCPWGSNKIFVRRSTYTIHLRAITSDLGGNPGPYGIENHKVNWNMEHGVMFFNIIYQGFH